MRSDNSHSPQMLPLVTAVLLLGSLGLFLLAPAAVAEVREELLVTTEWLAGHLDDPGVAVIHVAHPGKAEAGAAAYEKAHVPGARFLPWESIATPRDDIPNEFPESDELRQTFEALGIGGAERIVIYDDGAGLAAARAYVALDLLGLGARAALLDGQWAKWKSEERPVSDQAPAVEAKALEIAPRIETVTTLAGMRQLYSTVRPSPIAPKLVDSRPEAQFTGAEPGRDIQRAGHIPGARHVYWKDHLKDGELPVLRPAAELQALYNDAGITERDTVITYCRTGGQASHTYFVLKYLGHRVSLYDGSFIEWQQNEKRPVTAMQ